jgi:hypothetical protein
VGLVVVVLVGALAVGRLAGGSVRGLSWLRLDGAWLVVAALAAQLGGTAVGVLAAGAAEPAYAIGLAVSAALALWFCARNLSVAGVPLVTLGLVLNAAVVLANGAMPVSLYAVARAGVPTGPIAGGSDQRHELAVPGTRLGVLGDRVPVPLPLRPEVASVGDVLVAAGIGQLVVAGMRRRTPRRAA